jgi:hypothetical protein
MYEKHHFPSREGVQQWPRHREVTQEFTSIYILAQGNYVNINHWCISLFGVNIFQGESVVEPTEQTHLAYGPHK